MFDRYHQDSIKGHTRIVRASGVTRRFHLHLATELPSQTVVLTVTQNKMQLTDLILQSLQEDSIVSRQKLVVTGLNDTPIQIHNGVVTELILLKTSHEEADVIMINQLLWVVTTSSRLRPNIRFGSVRFGNSADFSRFGKVRFRFRLSEY